MKAKTKTTATKEEATPALVPKLRFPEFRGAAGWTEKPLKAAAHINPANGGLPESFVYIDLESVDAGELKAKERISRAGAPSRAQRLVERGDIIYQVVRPYQRNNLLCEFDDDENYVASTGYAQLRAKGSNQFLYQSIHTDSFVGRVIAKCTGSNYPAINSSDLAEIHLPIPPTLPEQQKIAECLSSVDELIAAQARKVDALKTHKKGLMQQLFPREGETQPRLRFSNGKDWAVAALPEVAFFQEGPGIMAVDFHAEGVPLVRLAGVSGPFVTLDGCNYLDPAKVAQKWAHFRLAVNDLLISTSATFGLSSLVTEAAEGAVFYTGLIRFRPSSERLDRGYLETYLGSPHFARQAETAAVGGGIKHFGPSHLKQMEIPIPPLPEQQRIASCLSSLDALITAETQKHEALKTHKKGLMQQLFPAPTEHQHTSEGQRPGLFPPPEEVAG